MKPSRATARINPHVSSFIILGIDRAVSVPEATGPDPGREANTARAVAALVRP